MRVTPHGDMVPMQDTTVKFQPQKKFDTCASACDKHDGRRKLWSPRGRRSTCMQRARAVDGCATNRRSSLYQGDPVVTAITQWNPPVFHPHNLEPPRRPAGIFPQPLSRSLTRLQGGPDGPRGQRVPSWREPNHAVRVRRRVSVKRMYRVQNLMRSNLHSAQ